jgi:DNA polymerase-3 subunit delta
LDSVRPREVNNMIYVFFGADSLSIREKVDALRQAVGSADLRDANTLALDGVQVKPDELLAAAMAVPFLSDRRLVLVKGLLARFEGKRGKSPVGWKGIGEQLAAVPPTNDVVFVDGALGGKANPLLKELSGVAQVTGYPVPKGGEMHRWIRTRVERKGGAVSDQAVARLASAAGADLLALDNELEKLTVYVGARPIEPGDVDLMVSQGKEANIFAAVDAALNGRTAAALTQIRRVLDDGQSVSYVLYMLHRQVRLLILAKELQRQAVTGPDLGSRLGVRGYPLQKTMEQAPRFSAERLSAAHRLLTETDERIKTGQARGEVALDLLLADLGALGR